jgi:cytochrome c553
MNRPQRDLLRFAAAFACLAATQVRQPSRCADCHFANPGSTTMWHLSDWENSAHGRNGVGCEGCHGGDPTTFDSFPAHQGIRKATEPGSPLHRVNIPRTCGACHPGPFAQFQKSKHYELVRAGDREAPTCITCHGNNGAYLPSPKALASECARCHGAGKRAQNMDRPADGRLNFTRVREIRSSLEESQRGIRKVKDAGRRQKLEAELQEARAALAAAVHAAHAFVFDEMRARLDTASARADLLRQEVAKTSADRK